MTDAKPYDIKAMGIWELDQLLEKRPDMAKEITEEINRRVAEHDES